ncbi:MAG: hypothetical protein IPG56_11275 [Caulobacteraceae bacterium]|nr:hypothetical protein [Caulobacteraceae bacterium]
MRRNDDGFAIAEIDFKLRGAGDVLGTQQSGLPPFRLVSPEAHADMLGAADKEARLSVERDPDLKSPRGEAIRLVLSLLVMPTPQNWHALASALAFCGCLGFSGADMPNPRSPATSERRMKSASSQR